MTVHGIIKRTRVQGTALGKSEGLPLHKTRCGIPPIELGPDGYSIDDDEVTCHACLDKRQTERGPT